ncbi:hypothetical protein Fcan01_28627 [Folsomia candida]|uniref:Uncharacterized protein n=1 Tax=Folsomia candida TaxID=158441 RepID=A0A226CUP1_FOLCA|nr:hypothetical protein Fcan01_28627 [Folsomia candida]
MCHSSMPIATMAALLMLYYKLSYPPSCPDVWEAAKLFILFCVVALIPCFTPTSFLITFKAMELCAIINPVKHLGDRFREPRTVNRKTGGMFEIVLKQSISYLFWWCPGILAMAIWLELDPFSDVLDGLCSWISTKFRGIF